MNQHHHYEKEERDYLSSLQAVRERCFKVQEIAVKNKLHHFNIDSSKLQDIVQLVISLLKRDYYDFDSQQLQIPSHGRWRHFDAGGCARIQALLIDPWTKMGVDSLEQTRRILDLFVIAVLLDLDPSQGYSYQESTHHRIYKKREGMAIAILEMFMNGVFSINPEEPHRVDSEALMQLTLDDLLSGLKTTSDELIGIEDRFELLKHLAQVLQVRTDYFGGQEGFMPRPGNMMDYLLNHPTTIKTKKGPLIRLETLWPIVFEMGELWTVQSDYSNGDVWSCCSNDNLLVPIHKLSQWMIYTLIEPMEKLLGAVIEGTEQLTPLPDYANGGLLIDTGLITLKSQDYERGIENYRQHTNLLGQSKVEMIPMFDISDSAIIEWRALTIAYLDLVCDRVRAALKLTRKALSLTQLIEGGTTSAGRELAELSRPNTQQPPILIKVCIQ
ncbi:uncharacterized protein BX663DRAFT_530376 [Cokeromyces recurvatus]|uniref:uncharacterized protein n=1 Tax=Cokeromyces recurvatus TaxID=90255 RepID=UPI00221F9DB4|nr:uncharacterized protein BX663DRAFT_530376 [Cokeromyces recurvatus]KAI7904272.1 hypothetical protein BX663DRAFT_530376 [Cokeromyces recurvatus]